MATSVASVASAASAASVVSAAFRSFQLLEVCLSQHQASLHASTQLTQGRWGGAAPDASRAKAGSERTLGWGGAWHFVTGSEGAPVSLFCSRSILCNKVKEYKLVADAVSRGTRPKMAPTTPHTEYAP